MCVLSCPALTAIDCQALSMGFPQQGHWGGLPCPPPGDLPDPGIKPASPVTSCIADSLLLSPWGIPEKNKSKKQNPKWSRRKEMIK